MDLTLTHHPLEITPLLVAKPVNFQHTSGPSSDDVEEGQIPMNKVARNNLRVTLNDAVNVHQCLDIKYSKLVISLLTPTQFH